MILQSEAQFQQFVHCKFRESIVRALYLPPTPHVSHAFLIVNKFGKVGLYDPVRFTLFHTYLLDLSLWHHPDSARRMSTVSFQQPKCQRSHLVVDAVFVPHLSTICYLTNKGILQGFDIGEQETERYGIDLLPDRSFGHLKSGKSPTEVKNAGHVETHRIYGLPPFPTSMEYYSWEATTTSAEDYLPPGQQFQGTLLIGSSDGSVTLVRIPDSKHVFGRRKIRGVVHEIHNEELVRMGLVTRVRGHNEPVTDLLLLPAHQLLASTSKDRKFSVIFKDLRGILDPSIISLPKGANSMAHSETLSIFAIGSDDCLVRLFNQFIPKKAVAELRGHRAPVISVNFIQLPFSPRPILLTFSTDVELRAWDPMTGDLIQSLYISVPIKSSIICKTPEFSRRAIVDFQNGPSREPLGKERVKRQRSIRDDDTGGFLLVLYSNSFAKVKLEREDTYWPFDFSELATEFESVATKYQDRKAKVTGSSPFANIPGHHLLSPAEIQEVESKVESYVNEIVSRDKLMSGTKDSKSLSAQLVQSCCTLREDKTRMQILRDGGAFKVLRTVDIVEPIQFTGQIPDVTELMREAKLTHVTCPADLISPAALKHFSSSDTLTTEMRTAASVARLSYAQLLGKREEENNSSGRSHSSEESQSTSKVVKNVDAAPDSYSDELLPVEILGDGTDSDEEDDEYLEWSLQRLMDDVTPKHPDVDCTAPK